MLETDFAGLKAAIADASKPLVIDLHAPWCGYCTRMRPDMERLSSERSDEIRFVAIDTDDHPDAFTHIGVKTLPTVVLYKDGQEIARRGSGNHAELSAWLAEHGL